MERVESRNLRLVRLPLQLLWGSKHSFASRSIAAIFAQYLGSGHRSRSMTEQTTRRTFIRMKTNERGMFALPRAVLLLQRRRSQKVCLPDAGASRGAAMAPLCAAHITIPHAPYDSFALGLRSYSSRSALPCYRYSPPIRMEACAAAMRGFELQAHRSLNISSCRQAQAIPRRWRFPAVS